MLHQLFIVISCCFVVAIILACHCVAVNNVARHQGPHPTAAHSGGCRGDTLLQVEAVLQRCSW